MNSQSLFTDHPGNIISAVTEWVTGGPSSVNIYRVNLSNLNRELVVSGNSGEIRRGKDGSIYVCTSGTTKVKKITNADAATPVATDYTVLTESGWQLSGTFPIQPHRLYPVLEVHYTRHVGDKRYELTDHLGNVRIVITDVKEPQSLSDGPHDFVAELKSANDYYPFGMLMPGRNINPDNYRFGFNGQEKDDEWRGITGADYDFSGYGYDALTCRRKRPDPATNEFPGISPYAVYNNNPVNNIDLDGKRVRPLNKESSEAFESHLSSFGDRESINKVFGLAIDPRKGTYYSTHLGDQVISSSRQLRRELRREGVRLSKEEGKSAYSTYLAIADQEVIELETIKAGTGSYTYGPGGEGTTVEGAAYDLNINPSLVRLQQDIQQAGSATPEIVNELFNPQDPGNERYPAKQRGTNYVFFKGVSPDKAVQGGGGIKGTIEVNTTNDPNASQTGSTIGTALEQLCPNE